MASRGLAILSGLLGGLGAAGRSVATERERARQEQERRVRDALLLRQIEVSEREQLARRAAEQVPLSRFRELVGPEVSSQLPQEVARGEEIPLRELQLILPLIKERLAKAEEARKLQGLAQGVQPSFEVAPEGAVEAPTPAVPSPVRGQDVRRRLALAKIIPSLGLQEARKQVGQFVMERTPEEELQALRGVVGAFGAGKGVVPPSVSTKVGKTTATFQPPRPGVHVPFSPEVQKQKLDISTQQTAGAVVAKEQFDFKQRQSYAQLAVDRIARIRDEVQKNPQTIGLPGAAASLATGALADVKNFSGLFGVDVGLPAQTQAYESAFASAAVTNEIIKSQILGVAMLVAAAEKFEGREMTQFKMEAIIKRLGAASHNPQSFVAVLDLFAKDLDERFRSYAKGVLGRDVPSMLSPGSGIQILGIERVQ